MFAGGVITLGTDALVFLCRCITLLLMQVKSENVKMGHLWLKNSPGMGQFRSLLAFQLFAPSEVIFCSFLSYLSHNLIAT